MIDYDKVFKYYLEFHEDINLLDLSNKLNDTFNVKVRIIDLVGVETHNDMLYGDTYSLKLDLFVVKDKEARRVKSDIDLLWPVLFYSKTISLDFIMECLKDRDYQVFERTIKDILYARTDIDKSIQLWLKLK